MLTPSKNKEHIIAPQRSPPNIIANPPSKKKKKGKCYNCHT